MGDIAWTRKYRPASFDEYMGDNVKNLIVNRFKDKNNIPNTVMLYGTRGTGKTSMARLMCKEIHCMSPVDGHSCGVCQMCLDIEEYITSTEAGIECYGIVEIDSAVTTGKSDVNDIIDEAIIPPMYPLEHKILIFDECHKLSNAAQNSLLKVLEEPPKHLIFILCTTDPSDVINTIQSRMQMKIEVRKKSVDEMAEKLLEISQKEKLIVSVEALKIIAKKGERVPRECISLLENIAKNYNNEITLDNVRASIGDIASEIYVEYFTAANTSMEKILLFNKKMKENDINARDFITGLTRFMLDACYVKHGINLEDYPIDFITQIKKIFDIYHSAEFDTALQVIEVAAKTISDDDIKNELMITTTALRIGKIGLMAQGLDKETVQAEKENKEALSKYKDEVEKDKQQKFEQIKEYSPSKETLSGVFKQMADVKGTTGILGVQIPLKETEVKQEDERFVSKDELSKFLD